MHTATRTIGLLALLLLSCSIPAFAHTGSVASGQSGFLHPLSGLDHSLAMMLVGIYAAQSSLRPLWLLPASFVGMMALGGILGFSGVHLPFPDAGIAMSVVVLGLAVALAVNSGRMLAMAVIGCFAVFHGYAHGAEMPAGTDMLVYAAGFLVATALLHMSGVALVTLLDRLPQPVRPSMARLVGGVSALVGAGFVDGVV